MVLRGIAEADPADRLPRASWLMPLVVSWFKPLTVSATFALAWTKL
jgi:hypothetical protein